MVHVNATKDTWQSVTSSQTVVLLSEREILHVSIALLNISAQNSFLWQIEFFQTKPDDGLLGPKHVVLFL